MNEYEAQKQQHYAIIKSNQLIQKTRYDLTIAEQKILLRLIQIIKPTDDSFRLYEFNIQDFCKICDIDYQNGKNYIRIKSIIKNLRDKSFWLNLPNGTETTCSWISKAYIQQNTGIIQFKLDDDLKPYLLQLKSNYTQYSLYYILGMQSKYSVRLYELLKSYQYTGQYTVSVGEFKEIMNATVYTHFCNLKQKVINTALAEINKLTDLNIAVELIKSGRKVDKIKFNIRQKNTAERVNIFLEKQGKKR